MANYSPFLQRVTRKCKLVFVIHRSFNTRCSSLLRFFYRVNNETLKSAGYVRLAFFTDCHMATSLHSIPSPSNPLQTTKKPLSVRTLLFHVSSRVKPPFFHMGLSASPREPVPFAFKVLTTSTLAAISAITHTLTSAIACSATGTTTNKASCAGPLHHLSDLIANISQSHAFRLRCVRGWFALGKDRRGLTRRDRGGGWGWIEQ